MVRGANLAAGWAGIYCGVDSEGGSKERTNEEARTKTVLTVGDRMLLRSLGWTHGADLFSAQA